MNIPLKTTVSSSIFAVDLFCGVGGLTRGLQEAGIDVIAGVDVDPTCLTLATLAVLIFFIALGG